MGKPSTERVTKYRARKKEQAIKRYKETTFRELKEITDDIGDYSALLHTYKESGITGLKHFITTDLKLFKFIDSIGIVYQICCCIQGTEVDHTHALVYLTDENVKEFHDFQLGAVGQRVKSRIKPIKNFEHLVNLVHYLSCSKASNNPKYKNCFKKHEHGPRKGVIEPHLFGNNRCAAVKALIKNLLS